MKKSIIPFILFVFLIVSCAPQRQYVTPENQSVSEKPNQIPIWFLNSRPNTDRFIYAVGSGSSLDHARNVATAELANYFDSYVKNKTEQMMRSLETERGEQSLIWFDWQTESLSRLRLPGVSYTRNVEVEELHYTEAQLDLEVFNRYHQEIASRITDLSNQGDIEIDPGRRFIYYGSAISLLPKTILPVEIQKQSAWTYLNGQLSELIDHLHSESKYEGEQIVVRISHANKPFRYVPIRFQNQKTVKADERGCYFLPSDIISGGEEFSLTIDIDLFPYPDDLNQDEIDRAKILLQRIAWQLPAPAPLIRIYIQASYTEENRPEDTGTVEHALARIVSNAGLRTTNDRSEATHLLEVEIETYLSSVNQHLGNFCKARGTVRLIGNSGVIKVFSFLDSDEQTKAVNQNRDVAFREARQKMLNLVEAQLTPYLRELDH